MREHGLVGLFFLPAFPHQEKVGNSLSSLRRHPPKNLP